MFVGCEVVSNKPLQHEEYFVVTKVGYLMVSLKVRDESEGTNTSRENN